MLIKQIWSRVLWLAIRGSIGLLPYDLAYGSAKKPIGLHQAIQIALKENRAIRMAENFRKSALLSNRMDHISLWAPKATFSISQYSRWPKRMQSGHWLSLAPFFTLSWDLQSVVDKIFETKTYRQKCTIDHLTAAKTIEKALQKVVTSHYALALAQKKGERLYTFIQIAATKLKIEKERLRLGFSYKTDYLNADLALKNAELTALEHQETLKEKQRNFNLVLGNAFHEEILVESDLSVQPIWDITAVTKEEVVELETAIEQKKVAMAKIALNKVKCYPLSCLSLSGEMRSSSYTYRFNDRKWDTDSPSSALKISIGVDLAKLLLMPLAIRKANMGLHNAVFELTQKEQSAEDGLKDKKWKYRHMLGLHKLAQERLKVTQQKLLLIKENYRLNQLKLLDVQEAEEAMQKAEINLIEYAFKVKQAEFDLYRLIGIHSHHWLVRHFCIYFFFLRLLCHSGEEIHVARVVNGLQ